MKLLTIVLATYNCDKYISKCINSVLSQNYKNIQLIIIDDCSTDNTEKICLNFLENDKRVEYYKNLHNMGVSSARNYGIEHADGEYITFIDSDDFVEKNMYEKMICEIEKDSVDIVMCDFYMEFEGKDIRPFKKQIQSLTRNEVYKKIFLIDYFCGFTWNKIYKKSIIKNNQLRFNSQIHICEDLLFNCEYFRFINKAIYFEEKMYHYIQRKDSAYNNVNFSKKWYSVIDCYEKIYQLIKECNKEIIYSFNFSYIYALLNLKEKVFLFKKNDDKIKELKKNAFKNISLKYKIKLFLKIYFFKLFFFFKKIKFK